MDQGEIVLNSMRPAPELFGRRAEKPHHQLVHNEQVFVFDPSSRIDLIWARRGSMYECSWVERSPGNNWTFYYKPEFGEDGLQLTGQLHWPMTEDSAYAFHDNRFARYQIGDSIRAFEKLVEVIKGIGVRRHSMANMGVIDRIKQMDLSWLKSDGDFLHTILGGSVKALPPEAVEIRYKVIPVFIADGCGSDCSFCDVKTGKKFSVRNRANIDEQIRLLKLHYLDSFIGYKGVFLGENNAFAAGIDNILYAATKAKQELVSSGVHPSLYMFSTVKDFLAAPDAVFDALTSLPYSTVHINIGIEAVTDDALKQLGKPQSRKVVLQALTRAGEINRKGYEKPFANRTTVSVNGVLGKALPPSHVQDFSQAFSETGYVGHAYFSQLTGNGNPLYIVECMKQLQQNGGGISAFLYVKQAL